jgi:hypothetical protein
MLIEFSEFSVNLYDNGYDNLINENMLFPNTLLSAFYTYIESDHESQTYQHHPYVILLWLLPRMIQNSINKLIHGIIDIPLMTNLLEKKWV